MLFNIILETPFTTWKEKILKNYFLIKNLLIFTAKELSLCHKLWFSNPYPNSKTLDFLNYELN